MARKAGDALERVLCDLDDLVMMMTDEEVELIERVGDAVLAGEQVSRADRARIRKLEERYL